MNTTLRSGGARLVAAVNVAMLFSALLPLATLADDCASASQPARTKPVSDLKLDALLLKHRPYLVVQQPDAHRDSRQ